MGIALQVAVDPNAPGLTPFSRFDASLRDIPRVLGIGATANEAPVLLVCCGRRKGTGTRRAAELYISPRVRLATRVARAVGKPFWIVSAKHGLLDPDRLVSPYDLSLDHLESRDLDWWRARLKEDLLRSYPSNIPRFVVLGSGEYANQIRHTLEDLRCSVETPIAGLPINLQLSWLKKAAKAMLRWNDLKRLYAGLDSLTESGGVLSLPEALEQTQLPQKGVYIFLDPEEVRHVGTGGPRVVRIGTHAVSEGSKATLRNRLRTHRGTGAGIGSHRSSIFRLHIGAALMRRSCQFSEIASWGLSKAYTPEILSVERPLEEAVSRYIARLRVAIVPIEDAATKFSLRRHLEKNLIALFTEDHIILDKANGGWLGNDSPNPTIRETGLWNINEAFTAYDPSSLSLVRWS